MVAITRYVVTPAGEVGSGGGDPVPTGLTATAGDAQVALSWTAPAPATGVTDYSVQYRTSPSGSWTTVAHGSTATSRTVTGLTNGTVYDFRVAAVRSGVTGVYTDAVSASPAASPGPSNLRATAGNAQVALTWTAPSPSTDVTDYAVQYRTSPSGSWTTFAHTASTATSRTVTGLSNATAYDFRVAAIRSGVTGVYTAGPVTATPLAPPTSATKYGINTNEKDTFNQTVAGRKAWFSNRVPVVRRYNGGFVPATWPITRAVAPEGRVSYSFKCDDRGGAFDAAKLAAGAGNARFKACIESIPGGSTGMREVWLTCFHEANDDIRDHNAGPNTIVNGVLKPYNGNPKHISHTELKQIYAQLYQVIQNATLAPGVVVKLTWNFMAYQLSKQGSGPTDPNAMFHDQWVPALGTAHLGGFDIYGNPGVNTSPSGSNRYGGPATGDRYGTTYPLPEVRCAEMFGVLDRTGWAKKWTILELNSPARDWDGDESGRAQWHKDMLELFQTRPAPPDVVCLWEAPSGTNWDQSYGRVGPVTAMVNAVKPYIVGTVS